MIRRLEYTEFKTLYRQRIAGDFPRWERRPLFVIRKLYAAGRYVCLTLEEDGRTMAYAGFIHHDAVGSVLLDYFAVDRERRGGGIGSRFLPMLREYWGDKAGILLECERPDHAKSTEAKRERERRIAFYTRGGAQKTALYWRAFGVDYTVLWLPIRHGAGKIELAGELPALYALSMPAALVSLCTKITPCGEAE